MYSMKKIKEALKQPDFCTAMTEIGFIIFGYDEQYPDIYYFMKENIIIVFYYGEGRFTIYRECRYGSLK